MTRGTSAPTPRPVTSRFRPGDLLRIRAECWRLVTATAYDTQVVLEVRGCDASNAGTTAIFLSPADAVLPLPRRTGTRFVTAAAWRRRACRVLADATPRIESLRCAAVADLAIMPFQLEPALAVTGGHGCRLLIADEVGLGKTVQAGLIIAEQLQRTTDGRALIVTPASLRLQWCDELRQRFHLSATMLDADNVARTHSLLAAGVNPWAIAPVIVVSIDYIKRPEVLRAVQSLVWDVVVLDEAHALCGSSDRAAAASQLAARARVLVSLTATPHAGDDDAFARLCRLGQPRDASPPMLFRRTKPDIGLPSTRRVRWLTLRSTPAEADMHRGLLGYVRRVSRQRLRDHRAALAMTVLVKRACSSATSLARSIERRLSLLSSSCDLLTNSQMLLPFEHGADEEPLGLLGIPGLDDPAAERALLEDVLERARVAARSERKLDALHRLLRRHPDPAIVFTEYRDTLEHVTASIRNRDIAVVHGGLTSSERQQALRRFIHGPATLLVATDAASEGLNLHQRCRRVINLELPWTPLRLEQRIGRVDRLGQRRIVHAVHLVAGGTAEEQIVARLLARMSRADEALAGAGRGGQDHLEIVDAVLDRPASARAASVVSSGRPYKAKSANLETEARSEATRLAIVRQLLQRAAPFPDEGRPFITRFRGTGRHQVWAVRLLFEDDHQHRQWSTVVGVEGSGLTHDNSTPWLAAIISRLYGGGIAATLATAGHVAQVAVEREHDIVAAIAAHRASRAPVEPGLFDRRHERLAASEARLIDEALEHCQRHVAALTRWSGLRLESAELVFGAFVG